MNVKNILSIMKKYNARLISTSLICALGVAIMFTLSNAYISLKYTLDDYMSKYIYPDIEIKTSPSTSNKTTFLNDMEGITDYSLHFTYDTVMRTSNKEYYSIRTTTYDETDFQKNYVWEEKKIKDKNIVYLEYKFALENNIHSGDKISIKVQGEYRDFYVAKLISMPETFAITIAGDSWTLSADFGYVYVSRSLFLDEFKLSTDETIKGLEEKYNELEQIEDPENIRYEDIQNIINNSDFIIPEMYSEWLNNPENFDQNSWLFNELMKSEQQDNDVRSQVENAIKDNNQYAYEDYFNKIVVKINKNENEKEIIKKLKNNLEKNGVKVSKVIPYNKSLVKQRIEHNIVPIKKMSYFIPIVFFVIVLNVVFLLINLIIKQCSRELGILKAIGYTTSKIRRMFMTMSFVIAIVAVVIGSIIGYVLTHLVSLYYQDFFPLPYIKYRYDIKMFIVTVLVTVIVTQVATLLSTKSIKSVSPVEVITGNMPEHNLEPNIFNHLKLMPMLKYSVISLFRNMNRFISGSLCVSASVMMIFVSLSMMSSEKYFYTELFEKRIHYDAEIYMYNDIDDKFVKEVKNLSFIKNVELVTFYNNKNIVFKDKKSSSSINLISQNTNMIGIYDRKNKPLKVKENGIIIDYITAKKLGVKKGDIVTIDDKKLKVIGLSFQNIKYNQYASATDIDKFNNSSMKKLIVQYEEGSEQKLLEFLQEKDNYLYTAFTSRTKYIIKEDCKLWNLICYIIIAFSAIIGYIIIINTNLTSLIEQKRKLCILKSIGYNNKAISKNWFCQSIIQLVTASVIGLPLGVYITIKALGYLDNSSHHYVFINSFNNYFLTILLVLIYLVISHIMCMKEMKSWDVATEIKSKE